ncbi:MAG: hypothetical protein AAF383_08690 [Cyanobacteria bacterium P01_A01_bin.83]
MSKLISKQHTNDGGYHIKRLVNEANEKLKQIGRQGKRATIVAKKSSLSLQFTFKDGKGRPQKNVGLGGIPVSADGIREAENIARLVTAQLVAGRFDWDWFNELIGKDASEQSKQLTCKEMVEQYKKHHFREKKNSKTPKCSWLNRYGNIEKVIGELEKPITLPLIRQIISLSDNNSESRKNSLNGLATLLKHFNNTDYKEVIKEYKTNNKIKRKTRNVPNDKKIAETYFGGFTPHLKCPKKNYNNFPQWQFLYGLLATYGLRIHEAWNIANWDKPVTLKNEDWVTIDIDDDSSIEVQRNGNDLIVPAILDPNNKGYILCIKDDTKTGHRVAFTLYPEGHNWIKEFNLLKELNLPDITDPLGKVGKDETAYKCSHATCKWFNRRKYGFTPHDLRHAWNHRGHQLGYNHKALADSLGHSITMNTTGYLHHMSDNVKFQGIKNAIKKDNEKRSRVEQLEEENKALKAQLEAVNKENERLKIELEMYKVIRESKN